MASAPVPAFMQFSSPCGFGPYEASREDGVCGSMSVICHKPPGCRQAVASTACSPLPVNHIFSANRLQSVPSASRVSPAIVTVPWSSLAGLRQLRSVPGGLARKSLKLSPFGGPSDSLSAERGHSGTESGADQRSADNPGGRGAGRSRHQSAARRAAHETHLLLLRNTGLALHPLAAGDHDAQQQREGDAAATLQTAHEVTADRRGASGVNARPPSLDDRDACIGIRCAL